MNTQNRKRISGIQIGSTVESKFHGHKGYKINDKVFQGKNKMAEAIQDHLSAIHLTEVFLASMTLPYLRT